MALPRLDPGTEGPVQASDKEAVKGIYDYCNARLLDSLETDGHRRFWYVWLRTLIFPWLKMNEWP